MDFEKLDQYIKQMQVIKQSEQALAEMIDRHLEAARGLEPFQSFFLAEKAFYSGAYETALKHYLDAKSIPEQNFFCYRTSAFVSEARNEQERTIAFAKKALQFHPQDFPTLTVLHRALLATKQWEEASTIGELLYKHNLGDENTCQASLSTKRPSVASLLDVPYHQHPLRQGDTPLAGTVLYNEPTDSQKMTMNKIRKLLLKSQNSLKLNSDPLTPQRNYRNMKSSCEKLNF